MLSHLKCPSTPLELGKVKVKASIRRNLLHSFYKSTLSPNSCAFHGDVAIASPTFPAAVVAKYLTSTSSSSLNFCRFGRMWCWMSSWPLGEGEAFDSDFSKAMMVVSAGRRLRTSMRTP